MRTGQDPLSSSLRLASYICICNREVSILYGETAIGERWSWQPCRSRHRLGCRGKARDGNAAASKLISSIFAAKGGVWIAG